MSARFWSPEEAIVFSDFLDRVEAGLRFPAVPSNKEPATHQAISLAKEK